MPTAFSQISDDFHEFIENCGELVQSVSSTGKIIYSNSTWREVLGYNDQDIDQLNVFDIIHPDDLAHCQKLFKEFFSQKTKQKNSIEFRFIKKDGSSIPVTGNISCKIENNEVVYTRGFFRDITDQLNLKDSLAESNLFLNSIVQNIPIMLFVKDSLDLKFVRINKAAENILGYKETELLGKNDHDFFPKKEADFFISQDQQVIKNGKIHDTPEEPLSTRHQGTRYLHTKKVPLYGKDGKPLFLLGISEDITEQKEISEKLHHKTNELEKANLEKDKEIHDRKKAEAALLLYQQQLRELSKRHQDIREEESIRIAREIHDGLGQLLTSLKLDLFWIEKNISGNKGDLLKKTAAMSNIVSQTIKIVQGIAKELRPEILEDFGLSAAIDWYTQEFHERHGIFVRLQENFDEERIPKDRTLTIYRIFQEALTNVARHAHAQNITVNLTDNLNNLILNIIDDGVGIEQHHITNPHSIGIIGMKERVIACKGDFDICKSEKGGTQITIKIPME